MLNASFSKKKVKKKLKRILQIKYTAWCRGIHFLRSKRTNLTQTPSSIKISERKK